MNLLKKYFKQTLFLFTFLFLVALLFACQITASSQITNVTITIKANVKAQVYISNIYRGDTPLTITIGTGKYPLKLMANGYKTFETVITVSPTGPKEFSYNLEQIASTGTTTTTTSSGGSGKARLIVKADIPCYVYSNNVRIGMTPIDVEIYPGTYEIKAEPTDKNYAPKTEKINLNKGEVKELFFKFLSDQPQTYSVTINSNVPAQVLINNKLIGTTPLNTTLAPGTYTITLNPTQGGYSSLTQTIVVSAPNQVFNFTLSQMLYNIVINSNVPAQVLINNKLIGTTPLNTTLAPGTYTITLNPTQGGYSNLTQTIVVSAPNQVFNFTLTLITYNITINSNVPAQVFINNNPVGTTPLNTTLAPGTYTITLNPTQSGYSSLTQTIVVSAPNQVFNFTLTAANGNIIFNLPNDAKVFINGQMIQFKANSQISLPPGTYTIRIEYHGLVVEKTITVTSNQTITITIGLNLIIS